MVQHVVRMSWKWILVVGILFSGWSCGSSLEEEVVSNWPDGTKQKVYIFKRKGDLREKVAEEKYYENGQQEMLGELLGDMRHGNWTFWFEDGKIWTEGQFENDLRVGKTVIWRKNGTKNYEGTYSKGKPHGQWTFYDIDGTRLKDVFFEHGIKIREHNLKEGVPFQMPTTDSVNFKVG